MPAQQRAVPPGRAAGKSSGAKRRKAAPSRRAGGRSSSSKPRKTSGEKAGAAVAPMDLQAFAQQYQGDIPEAPMLATLRAEHRHIASVLALLSDHLNAIERSALVDTRVVREIMDYMVTWLDRNHHPREDLIFAYAADLNEDMAEDRRRLEKDHDSMARNGKDLLDLIDEWRLGEASGADLVRKGREYVQNSYAHMSIEEQEVFPAINELLDRSDWIELAADEQLKPIGDPVFGRRVQREFRNMARKLRRSLRRGVERRAVAEWVSIESLLEAYEVVSMAFQNSRSISRDQLLTSVRESAYILMDQPLRAPMYCTINNTRITLQWLEELQEVYRDAATDLLRVNRERRDRLRLLRRAGRQ